MCKNLNNVFKYLSPEACASTFPSGSEVGRSMIEMLGVLAIIGVLSVGGIAGYSKAMLMWHSNLQRHALASLIANAISLKPNLIAGLKKDNVDITSVFNAVGAVPEGFTFKNNYLYDLDNNMIYFNYGARKIGREDGSYYMQYEYLMGIRVKAGTNRLSLSAQDYCRNIFLVAKEIPQEINNVAFSSKDSDKWNGSNWQNLWYRANFKTFTMAQVNETCRLAAKEGGTGTFYIFLKAD